MSSVTRGAQMLDALRTLARTQGGVFSRSQIDQLGFGYEVVRSQIAAGRCRRLHEGIFLLGNMAPAFVSVRWAALLACGEGAVLSHETAAEVFTVPFPRSRWVHVCVPADRVVVPPPGVRLHRSRLLPGKDTTYQGWPITTPADTVLDLVGQLRAPDAVVGLITDACRTDAVAPVAILEAMGHRRRQRHRQLVKDVLCDVVGGIESPLEHKYLIRVERSHGLPTGRRQVLSRLNGVTTRKDVHYDEYETVVELDGRAGHEGSGRHRDMRRDNASTVSRKSTLRYGHADMEEPCRAALEVGTVLSHHGWPGPLKACSPGCLAVQLNNV